MPGRPRTNTRVLLMRGSFKAHPERKKERENEPKGQIMSVTESPPPGFTHRQKTIWKEFISSAPYGMFEESDRHIIELTVIFMAEFREKNGDISQTRLTALLRGLQQLGKTPIERSKVVCRNKIEEKDGWADA